MTTRETHESGKSLAPLTPNGEALLVCALEFPVITSLPLE
ncbi:hypothetical protein SGPA1_11105 [Streptomyces misionensis JCM 4497]